MQAEDLILVTGATGNTGSALLQELEARGTRVRAMVRSHKDEARLAGTAAATVDANFDDPAFLAPALEGVTRAYLSHRRALTLRRSRCDSLSICPNPGPAARDPRKDRAPQIDARGLSGLALDSCGDFRPNRAMPLLFGRTMTTASSLLRLDAACVRVEKRCGHLGNPSEAEDRRESQKGYAGLGTLPHAHRFGSRLHEDAFVAKPGDDRPTDLF